MYNVQSILLHKYKLFLIVNYNQVKYLAIPDKKFHINVPPLLIFNELILINHKQDMCLQSTKLMQVAVIKSKIAIFIIKVKLKVTRSLTLV